MNRQPPIEPERYELFEAPRYHFEPDRREFVQLVGGGIAVFLVAGDALAQPPRQPGPRDIGSWLHIDEKGQVTVYTGKVEVGQNIRTSLTQVVAERGEAPEEVVVPLVLMTAPLAPHAAEELWERLGHDESLAHTDFPTADPQWLTVDTVEIAIQVNGKVRARVVVPSGLDEAGTEAANEAFCNSPNLPRFGPWDVEGNVQVSG